jgi:hypothetical protein
MQIDVNGVRIEPTSPVTLSVTNGIFAEINQSYSTSFEVVRSGAVDEALRLDRVPYDMLTGLPTFIDCAVQLNSHQLEGRLTVESVTKTHASVTLYVSTTQIPQSVLDMYLCELGIKGLGNGSRPFGWYLQDSVGAYNGVHFDNYITSHPDSVANPGTWYWQFPDIEMDTITREIEALAGLTSGTLPTLGTNYRMLLNSFNIPVDAPAEGYMDLWYDGIQGQFRNLMGQGTQSLAFETASAYNGEHIEFTAKKDLTNVAIRIGYDYRNGTLDNNQLTVFKRVGGISTPLGTYSLSGSGSISLITATLNEGESIRVIKYYNGTTDDWQAAIDVQVKGTYNVTTDDYFEPYEVLTHSSGDTFRGAHPETPTMGVVVPAFQYITVSSGIPKMTVREYLGLVLKHNGYGSNYTRQSVRVIGGIERFEADNEVSPAAGVIVTTKANEAVIFETHGSGIGDPAEVELPIYLGGNGLMSGPIVAGIVPEFEYNDAAKRGEYLSDNAKARDGNASLMFYNTTSVRFFDIPAVWQYFADMAGIAGHGTAEVRVTNIPDFVLFPDIIEVNGWVLYVVSTEIDTNSGFYTIKAIIKQ